MAETIAPRPQYKDLLQAGWDQGKFACVGLDLVYDRLPQSVKDKNHGDPYGSYMEFATNIIDATADLVLAYKPNFAFYEGDERTQAALDPILGHIRTRYPHIPVAGDGKRGDIGATSEQYAKMFDRWKIDAMTTNPYLGPSSYPALLKGHPDKGLIVLVKTSNPDAAFYQDAPVEVDEYAEIQEGAKLPLTDEEYKQLVEAQNSGLGREYYDLTYGRKVDSLPLFFYVATRTATAAKENPNIGIVVGATHPEAFAPVRKLAGNIPILVPALGTQGGDEEKTFRLAPDSNNQGIILNNGSAILYASGGEDYAEAARDALVKFDTKIRQGMGLAA